MDGLPITPGCLFPWGLETDDGKSIQDTGAQRCIRASQFKAMKRPLSPVSEEPAPIPPGSSSNDERRAMVTEAMLALRMTAVTTDASIDAINTHP